MTCIEMLKRQGTGNILVATCIGGDILPRVGDKIAFEGKFWLVIDIELSLSLVNPPFVKTDIGMVVKQWDGSNVNPCGVV